MAGKCLVSLIQCHRSRQHSNQTGTERISSPMKLNESLKSTAASRSAHGSGEGFGPFRFRLGDVPGRWGLVLY